MLQAQRQPQPDLPSAAIVERVADLLRVHTGVQLVDDGAQRIHKRMGQHVQAEHRGDYAAWIHALENTPTEQRYLVHRLVSHRTTFYAEPHHFIVLPRFMQRVRSTVQGARVWCAGCSTGEEAYSIVMCLVDHYGAQGCQDLDVWATDVNPKVLKAARKGIYKDAALTRLPVPVRAKFMARGSGRTSGYSKVRSEAQQFVRFEQANLLSQGRITEPVDVVFCRNVLCDLADQERDAVLDTLVDSVRSGGMLVVGQADAHLVKRAGVYKVGPSTFSKR